MFLSICVGPCCSYLPDGAQVVATAVGGVAVLPVMRHAAGVQKDDDDASCTGVGRCCSGLPDGAQRCCSAVGGVAVLPGMRRAAGVQKDDDDTSCTGLLTERLHALGLGFNTVRSCCRWCCCMC